ncbi:glycosyltransferase involved in cell wall biosynthesis [Novosphingobium sp. PhB165]|uniref:glycosyltransferase n=1 Tax=Novosphingobium sp. PhB165 TaxID=2485105 RepID=UPI0010525655|nr:glycosyltransferase [Novosphingobium sp. PhB165]TCM20829.1 glycosyltransferase involved in cell wall biosynthesis [Novosphingobium sp. PhB165]
MIEIAGSAASGPFVLPRRRGDTGGAAERRAQAQAVHGTASAQAAGTRRVAYLTNVYPKISHSFIRTEIAALERQGFAVSRFTVRRSDQPLVGQEDRAEAGLTTSLLDNAAGLAGAVAACLASRPGAVWRALRLSLRASGPGNRLRACAYFAEAALLARQLEREGTRHLHVHFGTNPAMVARLVAQLAPVTYSFTVHGPDEFDSPLALDLPGKIADAAFVAAVSSFGRGQLMRWSDPEHWNRIQVVHCAPDAPFFGDIETVPPGDASRFVCVARLSAQKGLPLLIEAVGRVAARRPIALDVLGDGEDRASIERQIARLGLGDSIRLLGWAGPEEIRSALSAARAFVLPSFAEGLPVVLMEAMALRRPVIATAIAGIPELVDDNVGWLVPSGSVDAIAEALEAALDAPADELGAMGERGRERVLQDHAPDRCAAGLAALLAPLV